jgi:hypothetical protein
MNRFVLAGLFAALASGGAYAADPTIEEAPPVAAPQISGHAEFYLGGLDLSMSSPFGDYDDTVWVYGGAARINVPFAERWNIQGDAIIDHISLADEGGGDITGYGGALHAYWRDPNSYALGVFGTLTQFDGDGGEADSFTVGPEGQMYFGNLTLYGQVWYGQLDFDMAPDSFDMWGIRGVARYFFQPNLRLDGELAFHNSNADFDFGDVDIDTFSVALQANYRFENTPLTVFGRYQFDTMQFTQPLIPEQDLDTHKFVVGLRASFGTGTLFDEDRHGATMDTNRSNYLIY